MVLIAIGTAPFVNVHVVVEGVVVNTLTRFVAEVASVEVIITTKAAGVTVPEKVIVAKIPPVVPMTAPVVTVSLPAVFVEPASIEAATLPPVPAPAPTATVGAEPVDLNLRELIVALLLMAVVVVVPVRTGPAIDGEVANTTKPVPVAAFQLGAVLKDPVPVCVSTAIAEEVLPASKEVVPGAL